jgi:hypothetical protein
MVHSALGSLAGQKTSSEPKQTYDLGLFYKVIKLHFKPFLCKSSAGFSLSFKTPGESLTLPRLKEIIALKKRKWSSIPPHDVNDVTSSSRTSKSSLNGVLVLFRSTCWSLAHVFCSRVAAPHLTGSSHSLTRTFSEKHLSRFCCFFSVLSNGEQRSCAHGNAEHHFRERLGFA